MERDRGGLFMQIGDCPPITSEAFKRDCWRASTAIAWVYILAASVFIVWQFGRP